MKCQDKDYLVTVDYYSNFWEIDYVENTLSKYQLCTFLFLVYIEDVCHISATVATYAVIVLVLHEAVSSKLILAVCDLTSLELFFRH
jgi:hypothetical protein